MKSWQVCQAPVQQPRGLTAEQEPSTWGVCTESPQTRPHRLFPKPRGHAVSWASVAHRCVPCLQGNRPAGNPPLEFMANGLTSVKLLGKQTPHARTQLGPGTRAGENVPSKRV
ncbi:hypothetical protein KIL84_001769 [Mauremys mutica]|uniref:Uncharacterized protein n=1 Tax=Mauremys mutica TaxID=74926 RepID=A0A9D3XKK1_9SAUR|nr:hypothetical protein KIL84_001769 [Mauremys mutica]